MPAVEGSEKSPHDDWSRSPETHIPASNMRIIMVERFELKMKCFMRGGSPY